MSIDLVRLLDVLQQLLWPLIRTGAFMLSAPLFAVEALNVRFRVAMAVVLAVFMFGQVPLPQQDLLGLAGLAMVGAEVLVGVVLGLCLQVVTAAVAVAGAAVSNAMGLSFANIVDPALGNIPVVSQLFVVIATLVFLGLDGHLLLVGLLLDSFRGIPVGSYPDLAVWFDLMAAWTPLIFIAGLGLALPVVVSLLMINLGLGIITRAAPAMNIFSIGFPALLLSGMLFLYFAMPGIFSGTSSLWLQALDTARLLMGG